MKNSNNQRIYSLSEEIFSSLSEALYDNNYDKARSIAYNLDSVEIADFLIIASNAQCEQFVDATKNNFGPRVFLHLDGELLIKIIEMLGVEKSVQVMQALTIDDLIDVISEISDDKLQEQIISLLPHKTKRILKELLSYPEESVGRLVHKDLITVLETWTVGEIIEFLRNYKHIPQKFYQIFIVDENHHPVGSVSASKILSSNKNVVINDIMDRNIKVVTTDFDRKKVAFIFRKYELTSMPVVDDQQRIIGSISINDIVDIIEEGAEEDILKFGGLKERDIHARLVENIQQRLPWLITNIIMATMSSSVIRLFEATITQAVILASLLMIIASSGNNVAFQTVTLMIRALACKEINKMNALRVIGKEVLSGMINGILISILSFVMLTIFCTNMQIATIFSLSIIIVFTVSTFVGASIPLILNSFNIDPAIASPTLVATASDLVSFFVFLGMASKVLSLD